jgi:hypothetical protein
MTDARGSLQDLHDEHAVPPVSSDCQDEIMKELTWIYFIHLLI